MSTEEDKQIIIQNYPFVVFILLFQSYDEKGGKTRIKMANFSFKNYFSIKNLGFRIFLIILCIFLDFSTF